MNPNTFYNRIGKGYTLKRALEQPVNKGIYSTDFQVGEKIYKQLKNPVMMGDEINVLL